MAASSAESGVPLLTDIERIMIKAIVRLVVDDQGQDLVEYALLSGIVGALGVLLFPTIAGKMSAAYLNWQSQAQTAWEPCAPGGC
jgi:Flp pilus assembly pilin Flp